MCIQIHDPEGRCVFEDDDDDDDEHPCTTIRTQIGQRGGGVRWILDFVPRPVAPVQSVFRVTARSCAYVIPRFLFMYRMHAGKPRFPVRRRRWFTPFRPDRLKQQCSFITRIIIIIIISDNTNTYKRITSCTQRWRLALPSITRTVRWRDPMKTFNCFYLKSLHNTV